MNSFLFKNIPGALTRQRSEVRVMAVVMEVMVMVVVMEVMVMAVVMEVMGHR